MPFAPSGYQFYRNVMDFGAVGDGINDDTEGITPCLYIYFAFVKSSTGATRDSWTNNIKAINQAVAW